MKKVFSFLWETIKIVFLALIIVIPIRYFIFQPFVVSGQSMEPTLLSGDYLIVDEISYRFRDPSRGEIIVFRYPEDPKTRHIKRIIGLPGEKIEIDNEIITILAIDGTTFFLNESEYHPYLGNIDNVSIVLKEDEYFVMGDNRPISFDSRKWGALPKENIVGRFFVRLLPLKSFQKVTIPEY